MRSSNILIGVAPEAYNRLELMLEMYYSLSSNTVSQDQILEGIGRFRADAVILDQSISGALTAAEFHASIKATYPDLKIIYYAEDTAHLLQDVLAGKRPVDDPSFLNEPASAADIEQAVIQDVQLWENENRAKRTDTKKISPSDVHPTEEDWGLSTEATIDIHGFEKKIVVVTGAVGGIGKTDLSINLAVRFSEQGFKTILCGFNLQNDDLTRRLGLEYKRGKKLTTAFELYSNDRLSYAALEDIMQKYRKLDVLVGIEKPEERQDMTKEFFQDISRLLKSNYDVVVIDTENNSYSPSYLPLILIADHVLCPCTSHNSSLEQLRDELHSWKEDYDIPLSKVDILFNRYNEGGFLTKDLVEKNTSREVIAEIPYSMDILKGSEREEPGVLRNSRDGRKIRRAMDKVVFRITGKIRKGESSVKPGLLGLLKKVNAIAGR